MPQNRRGTARTDEASYGVPERTRETCRVLAAAGGLSRLRRTPSDAGWGESNRAQPAESLRIFDCFAGATAIGAVTRFSRAVRRNKVVLTGASLGVSSLRWAASP